jgi:hypothetical protein
MDGVREDGWREWGSKEKNGKCVKEGRKERYRERPLRTKDCKTGRRGKRGVLMGRGWQFYCGGGRGGGPYLRVQIHTSMQPSQEVFVVEAG